MDAYADAYAGELRGVWVRGSEPKELVLSDGSRLMLEPGALDGGRVAWKRVAGHDGGDGDSAVSVSEAREMAGDDYADYVTVRTRAEAEWLRAVADWCGGEAERLDRELATAAAR